VGEKGSAHAASGLLIPAALNEVVSLPMEDRSLALQIQQLIPTPPLRNTSIWRSIFAGSHLSSKSKNASTSPAASVAPRFLAADGPAFV